MTQRALAIAGIGVLGAVLFCVLYGQINMLNLVGGFAAGAVSAAVFPLPADQSRRGVGARPVALARFLGYFVRDLVKSSLLVSRQVFWPTDRFRSAIIEVDVPTRHPSVLSLVSYEITVTPGTMVLDIDEPTGRVWIHALHIEGSGDDVIGDTIRLTQLACAALGIAPDDSTTKGPTS